MDTIERLKDLEQQIVGAEQQVGRGEEISMRAQWACGRELLKLRGDKKKLPDGRLDELAKELGRKRQDLQAGMKFAELYPTEEALSDAIRQFPSWHQMTHKGLKTKREPRTAIKKTRDAYICGLLNRATEVDPAVVHDHAVIVGLLHCLLDRYEPATDKKEAA